MSKHNVPSKNPGQRNRDRDKLPSYETETAPTFGDPSFLKPTSVSDSSSMGENDENEDSARSYSTERLDASTYTDQMSRTDSLEREQAILVGVYLPNQGKETDPLSELSGLAEAADVSVLGTLVQRRSVPDPACYLGKGKVDELADLVLGTGANVVLFDNDLAPSQTRNLEQKLKVKVLDRTELILDIFASRAQTYEACLAVELAQLEYAMPRLRRMWTHLERQAGGGVGLRGPGEKQLEVDRRIAQKKIASLKSELDRIDLRKKREVAGRTGSKTVCLVGYTNAGKSTLLNRLTDSGVFVKDLLFATLDTRTRRWMLPGWGPVLLSDTVGFIRNLPHHLIASFRATLSEATSADLLIHVADASHPEVITQIESAYQVLSDLNIREKDTVLVLNKIDKLESPEALERLTARYPLAITISAQEGSRLEKLTAAVSEALSREFRELSVEAFVGDGKTAAFLAREGEILSRSYQGDHVIFHCKLPQAAIGRLEKLHTDPITIREEGANAQNNESQSS